MLSLSYQRSITHRKLVDDEYGQRAGVGHGKIPISMLLGPLSGLESDAPKGCVCYKTGLPLDEPNGLKG